MNNILVIVDMQNDFINGSLANPDVRNIVPEIKNRIELARENKDFIVFTKDTHNTNYLDTYEGKLFPVEHCIEYTWGWEIVDELKEYADYVYEKSTYGCLDLAANLTLVDFDSIELCGAETDLALLSHAVIFKTFFPEKTISVNSKCCAGSTTYNHYKALNIMKNMHINVINED